ncbi:MAG: winged helix DNA-binding protein [Clostridia bacterium]|nr:winged helix DNA-binding protein [Clostridia bacterium]
MKVESAKLVLDACQQAAQLQRLLPPLPEGITPRCVRVIEQIRRLSEEGGLVRVSDISEILDVTRPGITNVLRDLEELGYVEKRRDGADSRIVFVSLTEKGEGLYRRYVQDYHRHLCDVFAELGDDGAKELARMIRFVVSAVATDLGE